MSGRADQDKVLKRVLDAATRLCVTTGSARADEIAVALHLTAAAASEALAALARRGDLVARPHGSYARPLVRNLRMPGASYVSSLRLPTALDMMGARA